MTKTLNRGDLITRLVGNDRIEHGRVAGVWFSQLGFEYIPSMVGIRINQEGITWIRGHHADDSPEVLALHTAYLLTRGVVG